MLFHSRNPQGRSQKKKDGSQRRGLLRQLEFGQHRDQAQARLPPGCVAGRPSEILDHARMIVSTDASVTAILTRSNPTLDGQ